MSEPTIGPQASRLAADFTIGHEADTIKATTKTIVPKLIYGTAWKKEKTEELVYEAIKQGFRAIDTAAQPGHYDEAAVGRGIQKAIKEGIIRREALFIQTKFTPPQPQDQDSDNTSLTDKIHQSIWSSQGNLLCPTPNPPHEDYLDSLVLHSPFVKLEDTLLAWRTMSEYHPELHQHREPSGVTMVVRHLGISHVSLDILIELCKEKVNPSFVQNRFHAKNDYDRHLRKFCRDNDIIFQSFWTADANKRLLKSVIVVEVMSKVGVGQYAAYYALVLGLGGVSVLDGTTDAIHMKENQEGIERVGVWAEGEGKDEWETCLEEFGDLIGEGLPQY